MSDERKNWLDRVGVIHLWNTIKAALDDKVDKIDGMGLSSNDFTIEEKKKLENLSDPAVASPENNGLMSAADKIKLDGIEKNATHYIHPSYEEKQAGLYRISVDNTGHVATADKMTADELKAEGISPAEHTHDLNKLAESLDMTTSTADDADVVVVGHDETDNNSVASKKYYRRTLSSIWDWIKSKTDTLYATVGHNHKITDLESYAEHVWDATTQRTQRTVLAAPTDKNGVASFRTLDKNDVGLGNVDNTPDSGKTVLKSATLSGFTSRSSQTWGNQTGTFVHGENDETGGSFAFRRDNPIRGQMSMILDGRFYQDEGRYMVLDTNNFSSYALPVGGYAKGTLFDKGQWVSLTDLDQNTWYPVVKQIPGGGLHHIKCNVQLGGMSKPSWSTHNGGFTANLDMLVTAAGQGATSARSICLDNSYQFTTENANPVGYGQMWNGSMAVFWLRGGGSYCLYSDWDGEWTLYTSTYTNNNQSIAPTTSYPGVSYNKATLEANSSYPVGAIYMSTDSTSPASIFGGSWQSIASERVLMGVSSSHGAGSTVDAGLPNISSGSDAALDIQGSWGAPACRAPFAQTWQGNSELSSSTWSSTPKVISARFDASLCNSIYGRSSTVQPAAYYVYMWRRTG